MLTNDRGLPQRLRAGVLEALQAGDAARATPPPPHASWRPGDAVRLSKGPMTGLDAVVMEIDGNAARVSILMFGHLRDVEVSLDCLMVRDE